MRFTADEALAISVGLLASRQLGLAEAVLAVESAQAKLERTLPAALTTRRRALVFSRRSLLAVSFAVCIKERTFFHDQALRDTYDLNRPD